MKDGKIILVCLSCSHAKGTPYALFKDGVDPKKDSLHAHEGTKKGQPATAASAHKQATKAWVDDGSPIIKVQGAVNERQQTIVEARPHMESAAERQKKNQFTTIFYLLDKLRPMTDYESMQPLLEYMGTPNLHSLHKSDTAGWDIADVINEVLLEGDKERVRNARFFAFSVDTSTDNTNTDMYNMELYIVEKSVRRCIFAAFADVQGQVDADGYMANAKQILKEVFGLSDEVIASKLVAIASDGASVLQGRRAGMIEKMKVGLV
jgi:hypothetical protein